MLARCAPWHAMRSCARCLLTALSRRVLVPAVRGRRDASRHRQLRAVEGRSVLPRTVRPVAHLPRCVCERPCDPTRPGDFFGRQKMSCFLS